ncbi:MAG: hemerythrin domain-containing protein [Gammaproteobacteria bacterium]|jgi:uncharacterized protein (DUF2249 family)
MSDFRVDLRECGGSSAHAYALSALRELRRGQEAELLAAEDPDMVLKAVNLDLRNALSWEQTESGPPLWRVRVRHRDDVEATELADLLTRDHERIDHLFANALHRLNAGDTATALPQFREYAQRLRNHVEAENEIIVPVLELPRAPSGDDPTSIMLREHDELIEQTHMIEEMLDEGMDDAGMLAPFFAIISGQLAKHEWREEQNLFPLWRHRLRADAALAAELFPKVRKLIKTGDEHR